MGSPHIYIVPFYEDEVRSYRTADDRKYVILRDPFLKLGLDPNQQITQLKRNPLYDGFLQCVPVTVMLGNGAARVFEMDALDLEMMPMCLAQLDLSRINEANKPKLLRYQRECAKALAAFWREREVIEVYLAPGFRTYEPEYSLAFMRRVCQLYHRPLPEKKYPCPIVVGVFIGQYIRSVLPEAVYRELRRQNPRNARGNRQRRDHQHFTMEFLSDGERERMKFCWQLMNAVEGIKEFEYLLKKHDLALQVEYHQATRYRGMLKPPQFQLPLVVEA
jgi:antirepressor protein/P63C domain-containing protein